MNDYKKTKNELVKELETLREQLRKIQENGSLNYSTGSDKNKGAARKGQPREEEYQAVIQAAFDGFWICNVKGEILEANNTFCKMLGYSREELQNMMIPDIEAAEKPEETARHLKKLMETGKDRFETRHRRRDGKIIEVEVSASYLPGAGGKIYVFTTEITERKKILKELEESEKKYRKLVDDINDGIFKTDTAGNIIFANKSLAHIHGFSDPEKLTGVNILELVRKDYKEKTRQTFINGVETGIFEQNFQVPVFNKKKRQYVFVSVNASLAEENNQIVVHGVIRDISQIKNAEEHLRISEMRLRTLINVTSRIVWITAGDGSVNSFQQGWNEFTGQSFEEMKGMGWLNAIHPDDMELTGREWLKAVQSKSLYEIVHRLKRADGTYRYFSVKGVPIIDDHGDIVEWIGTHTDITEQKEVELKLLRSEENHRAIFESAMDAMIIADFDGNIVDVNPAACLIYGYSHDEFIGKNAGDLIHPESLHKLVDFMESIKTKGSYKGGTIDIKKDGIPFNTEIYGSSINFNNQPHLLAVVRDVTEKNKAQALIKEREQRLENAIRHAPLPVMIHAEGGEILQISEAWTRITGYRHEDIPTIEDWCTKAYRVKKSEVKEIIKNLYTLESYSREGEFTISCKNGDQVVWDFGSARIGALSDGRKLVVSMAMDVTERKKAQAAILQEKQFVDSVINSMPGTFYLFSQSGKMKMWNNTFEQVSGYTKEEIAQMSPFDFFDPKDHQIVSKSIETAFQGETVSLEIEFISKQGGKHPFYFTGKRIDLNDEPHILGVGVDIADRIKAQEERDRFFTVSLDLLCIAGRDGYFKRLNPAWENLLGYTTEELTMRPFIEFVHPDHIEATLKEVEKLVDGRPTVSFINRYRCKDGSYKWLSWNTAPFEDVLYAAATDITELKENQEKIEKLNSYFEAMLSNTTDFMFFKDIDHRFVASSDSLAKITGFQKGKDLLGKLDWDIFEKNDAENYYRLEREIFRTGEPVREVQSFLNEHNQRGWVDNRKFPIRDNQGKIIGLFGVARDITELKQTEMNLQKAKKRLEIALEGGDIGIWEWDLKTDRVIWDQRMEKIFGLDPDTFGQDFTSFKACLHPDDIDLTETAVRKALDENLPFELIYRVVWKNNEIRYIHASATVIRDEREEPKQMIGVCVDVTEIKTAEQQIRTAAEELKRSNEELEQFAYVASHDLQEPLRMVSSYTQLLEKRYKDQLDDKANTYIHYAVDGANRMQRLITDLLEFSRITTHGEGFETMNCDMVLERSLANLDADIQKTNAEIIREKLPEIKGDASQFERLFQNLIGNALKFCKDKNPIIHLSAKSHKNEWIFSVQDNGIGIDPKFEKRVFVIFQRLHGRAEFPGTGIGLAICKRIVERHGGKIWLESEPGNGTTFYFSIPK